jgi:hypothetical protein
VLVVDLLQQVVILFFLLLLVQEVVMVALEVLQAVLAVLGEEEERILQAEVVELGILQQLLLPKAIMVELVVDPVSDRLEEVEGLVVRALPQVVDRLAA